MATTTPTPPAKRGISGRTITLVILGILVLVGISMYNGMVNSEETVNQKWADVESSYKRRLDLIDNLVNTVKGAADFEKSTFTEIAEARAKVGQITIDPSTATPEQMKAFLDAQNGMNTSLSRLLVAVENYPQLTATQNFRDLQSQLEGTENRINTARIDYNAAVKEYNVRIRRFPANIFANLLGFNKRTPFEAPEGADVAPKVDFETEK